MLPARLARAAVANSTCCGHHMGPGGLEVIIPIKTLERYSASIMYH